MSSPSDFPTVEQAYVQAIRRRVLTAVGVTQGQSAADQYATLLAELLTWDSLEGGGQIKDDLRQSARRAFALLRDGPSEAEPGLGTHSWQLRTACLAVIADLPQEARKLLAVSQLKFASKPGEDWLQFSRDSVTAAWLGLLRQAGQTDVDSAQALLRALRELQRKFEGSYLATLKDAAEARRAALELLALYFLGTAAERLSEYLMKGTADGGGDIGSQLDMYFDRALNVLEKIPFVENFDIALLLQPTAHQLVNGSLRAATRGANTLTRQFADSLVNRTKQPLFQLLPPQRNALREQGLMSNSHRSVVVNFPTSSGKTLLAQFTILRALSDLGSERGWVAYVAPTRALVNQVTNRLRRDFGLLGKRVERLSPALEFDSVEISALAPKTEAQDGPPVDVFVCTPEKLDLLVRREELRERLGRLALVVVDEAHGLGARDPRAIKLELMLSMINREHADVRFLLLTPFIGNAARVAQWLDQTDYKDYAVEAEWVPNDRIIGIATPPSKSGVKAGTLATSILFQPIATPKKSLHLDELLELGKVSPKLKLTVAKLHSTAGALTAATGQVLSSRGPTVILCRTIKETWSIAKSLSQVEWPSLEGEDDRAAVARFVAHELGNSAPLVALLLSGVGVHHAGLPEEVAQAIEWLFEKQKLHVLCATTTLAQGVNFPIANLVIGSIFPTWTYGEFMPYSDFWNIAGRVGRVDQEAIGVVALIAKDDATRAKCEQFLKRSMTNLVSTLMSMVGDLGGLGEERGLSALVYKKEWSSFSQFIAHTLRQVGVAKFADQIELVLRGTLGYQTLRESNAFLARDLLTKTRQYANNMAKDMGSVSLVDATGFSFESVRGALGRLGQLDDLGDLADPVRLFSGSSQTLSDVMGVLLTIPEVKEELVEGGGQGQGRIAEMLADWVKGTSVEDLTARYFPTESVDDDAVSQCVKKFKKLSMTSAWGLASVLALHFGKDIENMPEETRQAVNNIPSMVLYGVWSQEQIALRSAGVPRNAALELSPHLEGSSSSYLLRKALNDGGKALWVTALGEDRGKDYFRVWEMLEGV
jgi:superfamily II DNA/RNA helicase